MFGGRAHLQDVIAAVLMWAPCSTEDVLAIVPQDLESVIHWHQDRMRVFICRALSPGYRCPSLVKRYIRPHRCKLFVMIHLGDGSAIEDVLREVLRPAFNLR